MGFGFFKKLFGGGADKGAPKPARSGKEQYARKQPVVLKSKHRSEPVPKVEIVSAQPYPLARHTDKGWLDGRQGERPERLEKFGLPRLRTPLELAEWLKLPPKTLAWLADHHGTNNAEKVAKKQHYRYLWEKKRSGFGFRLIESPKPLLKMVQRRIHAEILDRVPPHAAAHGFVHGRSIITNAQQHAGQYVVLKFDLEAFYPSIRFKRVVAIFRGLGYNREMTHWLARLCTNRVSAHLAPPPGEKRIPWEFDNLGRHLPQGAPTSPLLANLAAWGLDVRLSGAARRFGAVYTRYADDLTFSGSEKLLKGKTATLLIRYVRAIVRNEGYRWNILKKRVVRKGARQVVTGLTVNAKPNVGRREFETLKAILHNCVKLGPAAQNRANVPNFRAHLQGKIAFVRGVNPQKAARLQRDFDQIAW